MSWLVVSTPLKNMKVNGKDYPIWKKKCSKPPTRWGYFMGSNAREKSWQLVHCCRRDEAYWLPHSRSQGAEEFNDSFPIPSSLKPRSKSKEYMCSNPGPSKSCCFCVKKINDEKSELGPGLVIRGRYKKSAAIGDLGMVLTIHSGILRVSSV